MTWEKSLCGLQIEGMDDGHMLVGMGIKPWNHHMATWVLAYLFFSFKSLFIVCVMATTSVYWGSREWVICSIW
jgi:hypothetical protein